MLIKYLKKLVLFISIILFAALAVVAWFVSTESGLIVLFNLIDKYEYNMPIDIYFSEVSGSLLRGFTISDITVTSGDSLLVTGRSILGTGSIKGIGTDVLLKIDKLTLGFSFLGKNGIFPERVIIEGAESSFDELSSLLDYAATFGGGGGEIALLDFSLKSSDITNIPNMNPISISEVSLSKNVDLKLDIDVGDININVDQLIPLEQYLEMNMSSININVGSAGKINLDLALTPLTVVSVDFRDLDIAELLSASQISFDVDGNTGGNAYIEVTERGTSASGDLNFNGLKVSGVPISSFTSPWSFSDSDSVLRFRNISAIMRGMENLKGWAFVNTQNMSGTFYLNGEKLSLSDLEKTFNLGYPVEGENGSFHVKMEFENDNISGDIGIKIPSVTIEKQKIDDVSVGVSLKNGVASGNFAANLFGAPVKGSGYFSMEPPYNMRLDSTISELESSQLVFFVPAMAESLPKGKITADIKLDGTPDSIQANGTIKSDNFSIYGLNFQKPSISLSTDTSGLVNYKMTSSGGVALNTSGQIDFSKQLVSGSGNVSINPASVPALKGYGISGTINSNFEITGNLLDPAVTIKASGKNNNAFGTRIMQSSVSLNYSSGMLGIIDSSFQLDSNSFIWVKGNISFIGAEPIIDVYGTVKNFSLESYGINEKINGQFKILGAVSNAVITGNFTAPAANGDSLNVKISGTTKALAFEIGDTTIAEGSLGGKGRIEFPTRGSPAIDVDINAVNIRMHSLSEAYKINSPIGGIFTGNIKARGTLDAPLVELTTQYPLTLNKMLLDKLSLRLSAGKEGNFDLNAKALLGSALDLEFNGKIRKEKEGFAISLVSNSINVDELVQITSPALRDSFAGVVKLLAEIELFPKGKISFTLETPQLEAFGFVVNALRIPFEFSGDEINFIVERGNIGGALIFGDGAIDLLNEAWKASFSIKDIFLERLAEHLLSPMGGKLTGRGEGQFKLNGKLGMFPSVFGTGSFSASNGALIGLEEMEMINKERKFEFASINGGFVFNGKDVSITSGTSINAPPNDDFYRYIRFSGPLGIDGRGMRLNFSARIDIEILKILIKAFEGLISLASGGGATSNPARAVTERVLGIKRKTFNDVTFDLQGNFDNPVFSNLKIDREMSGVYEWGKTANDEGNSEKRRINLNINIAVGPGSSDSDVKGDLQQSILDILLDSVIPEVY